MKAKNPFEILADLDDQIDALMWKHQRLLDYIETEYLPKWEDADIYLCNHANLNCDECSQIGCQKWKQQRTRQTSQITATRGRILYRNSSPTCGRLGSFKIAKSKKSPKNA